MRLKPWFCVAAAALACGCANVPPPSNPGEGIAAVAPIVPIRKDRPVIGLALGSGGKRGFATN